MTFVCMKEIVIRSFLVMVIFGHFHFSIIFAFGIFVKRIYFCTLLNKVIWTRAYIHIYIIKS